MATTDNNAELIVAFLEVGQGDATVVVAPDESAGAVIDCADGAAPIVTDFLERCNVRVLKLVMVTHSDLDHAGGIVDVVRNFNGPTEWLAAFPDRPGSTNPQAGRRYNLLLREFVDLWREGINESIPLNGANWLVGNSILTILHPTQADFTDAVRRDIRNEASVVLRIECQGQRLLLGADVGEQGWRWMKDRCVDLKADVFKIPHHGAWYEGEPSLEEVLDLVSPAFAVISVGSSNGYGHPAIETFRALRSRHVGLRFACTQTTARCHPSTQTVAAEARSRLPTENRSNHQWLQQSCPCAGTVLLRIYQSGLDIRPTVEQHDEVISLFASPQCRVDVSKLFADGSEH